MYFKLALLNVRKSLKDYLIYFLTLTFSVCLFYAFNSFNTQQAIFELTSIQTQLMQAAGMILNFLSSYVAIIFGFLILYANNYLIKRRKKEFGILLVLGMPKSKISRILCYETIFIGILSMFSGLILGFLLSQGLTVMTASLFSFSISKFRFIFSWSATLITMISFAVIFIIITLFNTFIMRKYQCIDLLYADKSNEKIRINNTIASMLLFLVSLTLLGFAYYRVINYGIIAFEELGLTIILGSLGTLFFFMSLSGFLIKLAQLHKRTYLKNLNMFILRQVNSNINSNFASMSVVCIMLLLSIGALSTGISVSRSIDSAMESITPYDLSINIYHNIADSNLSQEEIFNSFMEHVDVDIEETFSDVRFLNAYWDETPDDIPSSLTYSAFSADIPKDKQITQLAERGETAILAFPLSIYNEFIQDFGYEPIDLKENEGVFVSDNSLGSDYIHIRSQYSDNFTLGEKILDIKSINYPVKNFSTGLLKNGIYLIVNDALVENLYLYNHFVNCNFDSNIDQEKILDKIDKNYIDKIAEDYQFFYLTRQEIYDQNQGMKLTYTYVGLYLGFVFAIASCVILALQQLSQAFDNARQFSILNRLGVDSKMAYTTLKKQIAIYFIIPLLLAIVHSIVGIKAVSDAIAVIGKGDFYYTSSLTSCIIIAIYGSYYYATYVSYKRIINS